MGMYPLIEDAQHERFSRPAFNDQTGHCVSCGRDNSGHEGEPCSDDCPMYWEEDGRQPE